MPGLSVLFNNSNVPVTGISTDWLNSRTMRGLFGEPKKVPPAEINFFAPLKSWTCTHSLNVTGSSDFFSSTVMPMLCATLRTLTLFTSFKLLVDKNPRSIARVTGSMFGNCRALPP